MLRTGRILIVAAVFALLAREAHAQQPALAAPPSVAQATTDWGPLSPETTPPPWVVPPQGVGPYEDDNGELLKGDSLLDGPPYAPPGWFAAVELAPVWSHVKNRLTQTVTAGPLTTEVHLGAADLDVTVQPRFEFGYRLAQGTGSLLVSYRFVDTAGSGDMSHFGPREDAASVHSRFDLNVVDLDYGSREFSLGPRWDMQWFAGVRFGSVFFDSQASDGVVAQRVSDHFNAAGPVAALELWRQVGDMGLALFGRLESSFLVGRIQQQFAEGLPRGAGETDQSQIQGAPTLAVQAGLGWTPPGNQRWRLAGGYTFERWWQIGAIPGSSAEVTVQGLFLRGEWRY
jgi:hypothetical protein